MGLYICKKLIVGFLKNYIEVGPIFFYEKKLKSTPHSKKTMGVGAIVVVL